jgi:WD40 repeat protein
VLDGGWAERLDLLRQRLGEPRHVELLASDAINVPMTVGWRRPAIVLPSSALETLELHQDAVLMHELAHIRRRDFLDVVILQLAQILYWCHPLTWIIGIVGRNLRERACDDICIHWMGAAAPYRNALLAIAHKTICKPRLAIGSAMLHSSRLSRRVAQINCSSGDSRCIPAGSVRLSVYCGMVSIAALAAVVQLVPQVDAARAAELAQTKNGAQSKENTAAGAQRTDAAISRYEREQAAIENRGEEPSSLVAILGSSRLKHWAYVNAVAWSPDGSMLGSAGGDGVLRLWDPDTGEQRKRFKSEPAWAFGAPHLTSLAFEPTGQRVAAGLGTNAVRVWDIATGAETHFLKDDGEVLSVAWHPTEPLLATGGELVAKLWDLSTGKVARVLDPQNKSFKRQFTTDWVRLAFTANGQHVIVAHPDGSVRFWNIDTGDVTRTIQAHDVAIQAIAIDEARDRLATGGRDGKVRLWKSSTGESLCEIQAYKEYVQGLAFHPERDVIYSGGLGGIICTWDMRTGEKLFEFASSRGAGTGTLAHHPSRDLIASAGYSVQLWSADTGTPHLAVSGHLGGIEALKFAPDGSKLITSGRDSTLRVWDTKSRQPLAVYELEQPSASIALTPNGKSLVTISRYRGAIDIRSLEDGSILNSFKAEGELNEAVAISPDGRWLAATSSGKIEDGALTLWDLSKNALHGRIRTHRGRPHFSHDGTSLLVAGTEFQFGKGSKGRLSLWDVESLNNTLSLEDVQGLARISDSALSADGTTLALAGTSFDKDEKSHNQLVFWDWTKNETRLVVDMQEHSPTVVAISPDGSSVFTAAALQGEARVWDVRDGALRETFQLCEGGHWAIGPAAFTADSRQVAVAMGNGTIFMIGVKQPPRGVAAKVAVPAPAEEPPADPWQALLGRPAPEFQPEGWLFGEPTTLAALRGKWVALYFWSDAFSDQDMPAWMDMQERLGEKAPTVIVVNPNFDDSGPPMEKQRKFFEHYSRESWEGRPLPFRVLVDKRRPNVIEGTNIETAGATFAAYRVMNARRGYRLPSVALLIGPDGSIKQQFSSRPYPSAIRGLENLMGVKARTPKWETELLEAYTLPAGENLRRMAPPYSQAREDYRFFHHGRGECTMTFEQHETLRQKWTTTRSEVPLEFVLDSVVGIKSYEVVDPDDVVKRMIVGDWCHRVGTPREELLEALERIVQSELGWKVRFESTTARREVVVATGKWEQAPLPGLKGQNIYLTVDDDPHPTSGGGGSGSVDEMFSWLGDRISMRFVNKVVFPPNGPLVWQDRLARDMDEIRKQTPAGKEMLARLLKKLSLQTGLSLQVEEREVGVWRIVSE